MRTNIDINDALMDVAMRASGLPTKKATVEAALRVLVLRHEGQRAIAEMAGLGWEGDLEAMRAGDGRGG